MSDRLTELARQRALVSEHLAWLDREIAALRAVSPPPPPAPVSLPSPAGAAPIIPAATTSLGTNVAPVSKTSNPFSNPDTILEQYRVNPSTVKQDVRKGCFLYFIGAFVVVGIVVAILYFLIRSR